LVRSSALIAVLAAALLPTHASASSLVYTKDGNVWLGSPDGAVERHIIL
jgi:hypothetical protein